MFDMLGLVCYTGSVTGNKYAFGLLLAVIALLVYAVATTYILVNDPIPRLHRFPKLDSIQDDLESPFMIVCTAYSNRPNEDLQKERYGKEMIGFRVISDCKTLPVERGTNE